MKEDGDPKDSNIQLKWGTIALSDLPLLPSSQIWNHIWSGDALPKINIFCWIMVHGKLLTRRIFKGRNSRAIKMHVCAIMQLKHRGTCFLNVHSQCRFGVFL
jgi:hypothetical protein